VIELQGVTAVYGRTVALYGLDLQLHPGVTGLFGPNGSGKSTLLRLLSGLSRPAGGRVVWNGHDVNASDEAFRSSLGYAGHSSGLYLKLSVKENLRLFAHLYGADATRAEAMVEALGLGDKAATAVGALSAGFKRRAAVARALVHDPQILLLDEPYANLDDEAAGFITEAIIAWRRPDRLAVIATHGAKRVKSFADASLILQRGQAVSYRVRTPEETTA
jgi:heme ABC exporter ATP-binding subunit CcmA